MEIPNLFGKQLQFPTSFSWIIFPGIQSNLPQTKVLWPCALVAITWGYEESRVEEYENVIFLTTFWTLHAGITFSIGAFLTWLKEPCSFRHCSKDMCSSQASHHCGSPPLDTHRFSMSREMETPKLHGVFNMWLHSEQTGMITQSPGEVWYMLYQIS